MGATMILFLIPVVFLLQTVEGQEEICPDEKDIYPCSCRNSWWRGRSVVTCQKVKQGKQLEEILNATKNREISLEFNYAVFTDIPSDYFAGQNGVEIQFYSCKIDSFISKPFAGLEDTLTKVYIYKSLQKKRKDLESFPLDHLTKLKDFVFMSNDITRVGNDWFATGPVALEQIALELNNIEELGDKVFQALVNLQQAWLGSNKLKVLKRSMFPSPAAKLEELDLSHNEIEVLPDDMFTLMPKLVAINVENNKLKTLPEATWGIVWNQLEEMFVETNEKFVCDKEIAWIFQRQLPLHFRGHCYAPMSLKHRNLAELTADELL